MPYRARNNPVGQSALSSLPHANEGMHSGFEDLGFVLARDAQARKDIPVVLRSCLASGLVQ